MEEPKQPESERQEPGDRLLLPFTESDTIGSLIDSMLEPIRHVYREAKNDAVGTEGKPIPGERVRTIRLWLRTLLAFIRKNKDPISIIAVAIALVSTGIKETINDISRERSARLEKALDTDTSDGKYKVLYLAVRRLSPGPGPLVRVIDPTLTPAQKKRLTDCEELSLNAGFELERFKDLRAFLDTPIDPKPFYASYNWQLLNLDWSLNRAWSGHEHEGSILGTGPKLFPKKHQLLIFGTHPTTPTKNADIDKLYEDIHKIDYDIFKLLESTQDEVNKQAESARKFRESIKGINLFIVTLSIACAVFSQIIKGKAEIGIG